MHDAMRTRTSAEQMKEAALATVREVVGAIGLSSEVAALDDGDHELVIQRPGGSLLVLRPKAKAIPSVEWANTLQPEADRSFVVADQISAEVRERLNDLGIAWLDRRGHLRFVRDGIFIDTDVPSVPRPSNRLPGRSPINGRSGLAAASALLLRPDGPMGVSEIARVARLNASSISRAMTALVEAHLAESLGRGRYQPLFPELFWALADAWPRNRTVTGLGVSELARPELRAGVKDVDAVGWAMAGELGSVRWGAPMVLTSDFPCFFYVPDEQAIRTTLALRPASGPNATHGAGVSLAVDPTGLIVGQRWMPNHANLPIAHPLFCALDLTATSRDREALDQWDPPEGFVRVW